MSNTSKKEYETRIELYQNGKFFLGLQYNNVMWEYRNTATEDWKPLDFVAYQVLETIHKTHLILGTDLEEGDLK